MKKTVLVGIVAIAVLGVAGYLLPQSRYWPQEKISISLPYSTDHPPVGMEPIGETINHPKPSVPLGHPGIDFQWNEKVPIIASADGTVTSVSGGESGNVKTVNVSVRSGKYLIQYQELESIDSLIKKGAKVTTGQLIGYPHAPKINGVAGEGRQLHWDFGYALFIGEPLCPMDYFDEMSRLKILSDWESANYAHRDQFPDICSGDFKGRNK